MGFFGVAHVADVFFVHGVEVAALYPAIVDAGFFEFVNDSLVGVDDNAVGIGDAVAHKDASHSFACAVFDAVSRVDNDAAVVFTLLQKFYGFAFATHVQDDAFLHLSGDELFFAVDIDSATALAELLGGSVEDCGIVADMVRRVGAGSAIIRGVWEC